MPCYDPPHPESLLEAKMPAVLCALARKVGVAQIVAIVDWKEAGVTAEEFQQWIVQHNARDLRRRS